MKLLLENWRKFINEEYEPITTLRIFDFDETIAHTKSTTKIWYPGRSSIKNPTEPDEILADQEAFDKFMKSAAEREGIDSFDPINDLQDLGYEINLDDYSVVIEPDEITVVTDIMRNFPEDSKTYIMTARRGNALGPIMNYLDEIGIDSNQVRPIATQGESKGDVIAHMIGQKIMDDGKSNINRIEYYEDSEKNIVDVKLKVCDNPELNEIKPDNFELIIYKVVGFEAGHDRRYELEPVSC
tara:strand:+ start:223 stop:945 length:723 start_codon:yes stop_codon:yes gene_type:complete